MITLLHYLDRFFGNPSILMAATITAFFLKLYLFTHLITRRPQTTLSQRSWILLTLVLISAMVVDFAWIVLLADPLWITGMDHRLWLFPLRLAWGFFAIQYQALTLFIESFITTRLNRRHKITISISIFFFLFSIGLAIIDINCPNAASRPVIEYFMRTLQSIYLHLIIMPISLLITLWKIRTTNLPRILKQQLKIVIPAVIVPLWLLDILQEFPLSFFSPTFTTNSFSAATIGTLFITCAVFYCSRRVTALRFLNLKGHVQSKVRFNFIDGFKDVLEQLSHATNAPELRHITQTLFKEAFGIPLNKTKLYIRTPTHGTDNATTSDLSLHQGDTRIANMVENFLSTQSETILNHIMTSKILIYDEVVFTNFYEQRSEENATVVFLDLIDADIFLPIYEKQHMIAYIIVERHERPNHFYGNIEHDEMLVFSSYLGNIINLLQTRNLKMLLQQEKELKEELYHKHQEINQYKESIRSFLRTNQQKDIGIIFYKNRHFSFGNKAAKELIQININTQEGHPLAKALRLVARQVEEYKTPYMNFAQDKEGNKLVLSGVPNLEQNTVIITISHPEISDIIKRQIDLLQDPSKWDYLLYLETTQSGKLINQLIPGSGEKLLNFKITLLKLALSKKALLLEMPEEDLLPTVEIIHHISLRETLHIIKLQNSLRPHDIATKLFGINPLFGSQHTTTKPLLEQLNNIGTLFIQNIHLLDLETQEYLAEFIRYNLYRVFKSDQRVASNVRILCSTNQNLHTLVQEGSFSKTLFNELKQTSLSLPSLLTLSEEELATLADGFIEQAIKTQDLKTLLELTEKEKMRLSHHRPVSLHEFKEKIQQLLVNKSKKNQIYNETQFDPAYQLSDPQLIEAARLGKHALRDPKMMIMLWDKFKSQAKIATFLGVNRSSVNRRCKDFNLL